MAARPSGASGGSQSPVEWQLDHSPSPDVDDNTLRSAGVRLEAASELAIVRPAAERERSQVNTSSVPLIHRIRVSDLIASALALTAAGGIVVSMGSTPERWIGARWHWSAIVLAAVGSALMRLPVALAAQSRWQSNRQPVHLVTGGLVIIAMLAVGDLAYKHELPSLWETTSPAGLTTVAMWLAYECGLSSWYILATSLRRRAKPERA